MNSVPERAVRIPIREGLFAGSLDDLAAVHLQGSRCRDCGEVTLGQNSNCPNCGGHSTDPIELADHGSLWTYTVIRHKPPGDYRGPDPFKPFCLGLVELPDGIRVLAPIEGDVESMKIDLPLRLRISVHHTGSHVEEVVGFAFAR
jgi:uncharacterized protein